jgi:hypothetical protein
MATKTRKTKSQMGRDGERKLASGHGRNPKSGGEARNPPTGKPKREPVRGPTQSGASARAKNPTSRSRRRGSSQS